MDFWRRDRGTPDGDEGALQELIGPPVPGPTPAEFNGAKMNLIRQLRTSKQPRVTARRGIALRPAGVIAGVLTFGALAVGAAASSGITSVPDLLAELNVELPGAAESHVEGLPRRGPPEGIPPQGGPHLAPVIIESPAPQGAEAAAHGVAVSGAVAEVLNGDDEPSGPAIAAAACAAGQDHSNLPGQASLQSTGGPSAEACTKAADHASAAGGGSQITAPTIGLGNASPPVNVPPTGPGSGEGNPVGAPPAFPGQGQNHAAPGAAPPVPPPAAANPAAPDVIPPTGGGGGGLSLQPADAGAPTLPELPDEAIPPVTPGEPGAPVEGAPPAPPAPPAPDITPGTPPVVTPVPPSPH